MFAIGTVLTVGSGYIAADVGLTITDFFQSSPPDQLHSVWLFVLTIIWPAAAAFIYFVIQAGVVVRVLREKKPLCTFLRFPLFGELVLTKPECIVTLLASAISFILAQAAYYALSHRICTGTNARIDGSWIATLLETVSIGLIFAAWQMVTEDDWEVSLQTLCMTSFESN